MLADKNGFNDDESMRRFTTGFVIMTLFLLARARSLTAEQQPANIMFSEVQTGNLDSSSNEFVELFNADGDVYSLEGMVVQYRSASGSNWLTKASLNIDIAPRGRALVSSYHEEASEKLSSGFAASGGFVRLFDPEIEYEYDRVAWGSAVVDEPTMATLAPSKEESLKRATNEDGYFLTGTIQESWFISSTPTPSEDVLPVISDDQLGEADETQDEGAEPETDAETGDEVDDTSDTDTGSTDEASEIIDAPDTPGTQEEQEYSMVHITELLIDPDKPRVDSEDEFLELFNPNSTAVSLLGYSVETGLKNSYSFTLPDLIIAPGEYIALYAIDTGLVLSNSSGAARILNPAGEEIFAVPAYENAKADTVWTVDNTGVWGWSVNETPGTPATSGVVATAVEARAIARESAKTTASVKAASTVGSSAGSSGEGLSERSVYVEPEEEEPKINTQLLAGMGGLTVLYAGYEYRTDIANRIYQARRYFRRGRKNGANS